MERKKRKAYFTCSCGRKYRKKETAMVCVTSGCKRCGKVTKPQLANTYVRGTKKAHNVDYRADHQRAVNCHKTVMKKDTVTMSKTEFFEGDEMTLVGYYNMAFYPVLLYRGKSGKTLAVPKDRAGKYLKTVRA